MHRFGWNLFFQPGFGPGFFLILGSSGTCWILSLLLETVALGVLKGKVERLNFTHYVRSCQLSFVCLPIKGYTVACFDFYI